MLFTVPSRYWFPIGRWRYLALGGGPPRFPPDFACPAVLTQPQHPCPRRRRLRGSHPSPAPRSSGVRLRHGHGRGVSRPLPTVVLPPDGSADWLVTPPRFGLLPVRSPLLGESSLFLGVLRCFSSPGAPRIAAVPGHHPGRVAPFGDLGIAGCQRLPRAFRRVAASFLGRQRLGIHRAPISAASPAPSPAPRSRRPRTGASQKATAGRRRQRPRRSIPRPVVSWSCVCVPCVMLAVSARTTRPPRPQVRGRSTRLHLSRCGRAGQGRNGASVASWGGRRWSRGDSNPGPPPCKGGALPAKLRPRTSRQSAVVRRRFRRTVRLSGCRPSVRRPVGAPGLEPGTSALSGPRSDHLSYAPGRPPAARHHAVPSVAVAHPIGDPSRRRSATQCRKESVDAGGTAAAPRGSPPAARPVVPGLPRRTAPPPTPRPPLARGTNPGLGARPDGFAGRVLDLGCLGIRPRIAPRPSRRTP